MKNRKLYALVAGGVTVALLGGLLAVTTLAADPIPTVTFNEDTRKFEFRNVSNNNTTEEVGYPNLFQAMAAEEGGLMPGDNITQPIKVNTSGMSSSAWIDLTLKAENVRQELLDEGVTLNVYKGDVKEENLLATGDLANGVSLGSLDRNDELNLTVVLDIPIEAGNAIQGIDDTIEWVFTAGYHSGGGGGTDPGGGGGTDIPEPSTPLGDLPELEKGDHFAYIVGRDDGLVHPEAEINRAEVATIFFRLLKEESRNYYWATTNPYTDVPSDAWFNKAVSTLTNAGIIYGRGAGIFDPNASITRAEFAAMAVRFFGSGYEGPDMFSDIDGHWAQEAINQAANEGIISGYPDGTFRPDNNITRAEAISIINRVLDRRPEADHLLDGMTTWPDNMDTSTWYYEDIQEATNSHNFDPSEELDENGNQYEIWTELLPIRDWATLERAWTNSNESVNPGDVMFISSSDSYEVKS